tara:strand:- start:54 stop:1283 length:1230 start_codon:yes stop_codon:yes gene_type:complete
LTIWIGSCEKLKNETIAKVNGENISLSLYKSEYQTFLSKIYHEDNLVNRYAYLNNLIDEKLILKYAAENQLFEDSLFAKTAESIFDQLLLNFLFDKNINKSFHPSDSELRKFFSWQNTTIHVRHLFAKTKDKIENLNYRLSSSQETWENLAMECFQDSILKSNGGNLGWYNYNDLDPLFAYHAFSTSIGGISPPIRTKKGYSIIHVLEKEHNKLMLEKDFQLKMDEMKDIILNFRQNKLLLEYTDKTIETLAIKFNEENLQDLHQFLTFANHKILESFREEQIVSYKNTHLNVSEILSRLSKLSDQQLTQISTPLDLKQSITGILCREHFLLNALTNKIHQEDTFKKEFSRSKDNAMIEYVVNRLKNNQPTNSEENLKSEKEKYFQFRNVLLSKSNVTVDSSMVKNFIL